MVGTFIPAVSWSESQEDIISTNTMEFNRKKGGGGLKTKGNGQISLLVLKKSKSYVLAPY